MSGETVEQNIVNRGLNLGSKYSERLPIVVNRAGKVSIAHPFVTHNTKGRLDYYLLYLTRGKLTVTLRDGHATMKPGDFVIFPPKYKYRYELLDDDGVSYYFVHFTGSHVEKYFRELNISTTEPVVRAEHSDELSEAFSRFFESYEDKNSYDGVVVSVDFSRVLVLLAGAYRLNSRRSAVWRSLAYIKENYMSQIKIPYLAALEGLSVSRYNTVFRASVGVSPVKYIVKMRMRQACILLESTDLSVKQIGEMVGYSDNHFFSKLFKIYVGVSAVQYRSETDR